MKKFLFAAFVLVCAATLGASAQTVYASDKGEKYHTADCNLSGDANDMTLTAAKKAGKKACAVCKPESHFKDKTARCSGKTADGTRCKRMTSSKAGRCYQHKST
jgi:hypothetical protein